MSLAIRRPLIGVFANVWYPFPPEFRASEPYRREFSLQSIVWGIYCFARAGLRLTVLLVAVRVLGGLPGLELSVRPVAISWPPERRAADANGAAHRFSQMSTPAVLPGSIAAARCSTSSAARSSAS